LERKSRWAEIGGWRDVVDRHARAVERQRHERGHERRRSPPAAALSFDAAALSFDAVALSSGGGALLRRGGALLRWRRRYRVRRGRGRDVKFRSG
jgi:hypothetical protein